MPPKKQLPAPIDRPLSRAYLREFTGWSTAFPPGLSDPTSLRIMENMQINRDGSIRVRPGLRHLSYTSLPTDEAVGQGLANECVGTHEAFFLDDGTKAYLFAVREDDDTVGFRVLALTDTGATVNRLTDAGIDFAVAQGEAALNFTAATTYVKYLQIDNKIFALSNAGETMRLFYVGSPKTARKLSSVERPAWTVADKLIVVKPDASWITSDAMTTTRVNLLTNASFETYYTVESFSDLNIRALSTTQKKQGGKSLQMVSAKQRENYMPKPLYNVAATGFSPWAKGARTDHLEVGEFGLRVYNGDGNKTDKFYLNSPKFSGMDVGKRYVVAFTLVNSVNLTNIGVVWRFYNAAGTLMTTSADRDLGSLGDGRKVAAAITFPAGAVYATIHPYGNATAKDTGWFSVAHVVVCEEGEPTDAMTGYDGANYFWTGTPNNSHSVYHPPVPVDFKIKGGLVEPGVSYTGYLHARGTAARPTTVKLLFRDAAGATIGTFSSPTVNDTTTGWTKYTATGVAPANAVSCALHVTVTGVARGEYHYFDEGMIEAGTGLPWFDGTTTNTTTKTYSWQGQVGYSPSQEVTLAAATVMPSPETPTTNTLISSTKADNEFSFGYFYTFENEIGESAASQVTVVRAQRAWSQWKWEGVNGAGEPNDVEVTDPALAADQLVAYVPQAAYDAAKSQGAIRWNLYMLTWSDEDSVPVEGVLLESKDITASGVYGTEGWVRHSPLTTDRGFSAALPSEHGRYNYSTPSAAGQGLVAADRMILVDDPTAQAVIRWSSNLQGEYTNFTAAKGGGYKTLTSGNLFVPVSVKLWQNPQSADTLTILCAGLDGMNTAYYMAPASVAQQSEQVTVMGFEETTASPGTTSPYGCEVLNNALYHPLDEQLMKSTASNYNISHKSQTDQVQDRWSMLANKQRIVSSQHDNRLYYIVHNPLGAALEPGCMGNEVWVYDIASEKGTWSRWLTQGCSLRRIEQGGQIYMSLVRPDGIFFFDSEHDRDDTVDPVSHEVGTSFIPWRMETNTQGANRAHDAWAHLQQLTVAFGNMRGTVRYGIRSLDSHGKRVDIAKSFTDLGGLDEVEHLPYDVDDHLQIRKDLREWFFYASSTTDDSGAPILGYGQIDSVQYRYTPISVNIGYEYGSVETFEYGRAAANLANELAPNGVPAPMIDYRRP